MDVVLFQVIEQEFEWVKVFAFGRQELDLSPHTPQMQLAQSDCSAGWSDSLHGHIAPNGPIPEHLHVASCVAAATATRSISLVSVFLPDNSQCKTPLCFVSHELLGIP